VKKGEVKLLREKENWRIDAKEERNMEFYKNDCSNAVSS
jgi:hypothetical protein